MSGLNWGRAAARERANAVPRGKRERAGNQGAGLSRKRAALTRQQIAEAKRQAKNVPPMKIIRREDRPPGTATIASKRRPPTK